MMITELKTPLCQRSFLNWVSVEIYEAPRRASKRTRRFPGINAVAEKLGVDRIHLYREQVKIQMKKKGWSYRAASLRIGKSYQWICLVLNGRATSAPVLRAIHNLPQRSNKKSTS